MFYIALAFVCIGVALMAVGLLWAMGLMTAAQSFGIGRSEEMRDADTTHRSTMMGIVRLLLIGLVSAGIGFGLMVLGGA